MLSVVRAAVAACLVSAATAAPHWIPFPAPPNWHKTIDEGVAAAKKSGMAVLVVTAWTDQE